MPRPQASRSGTRDATLALGGGWLVFFLRLIATNAVPVDRDLFLTTIPLRHYLRERLLKGELPQWYPYELLGVPLAGSLIDATFHPQTLLLFLFGAANAVKWTVLLAYLAALVGTYRLARQVGTSRPAAVGGAYAMAFGGYAISMSNNVPYLWPLATAPWALWAVIRLLRRPTWSHAAETGIAFALILLGGDPQMLIGIAAFAAMILFIAKPTVRRCGMLFVSAALAGLLSAVELLPAWAVASESFRTQWKITPLLGTRWALAPLRLPEFLIPGYTPRNWTNDLGRLLYTGKDGVWAASLFMGAIVLGLGLLALTTAKRKAFTWSAVGMIAVWLALGGYGGLLQMAWRIAPPLVRLRYPEKYLGFLAVAIGPLCALGIDAFRTYPRRAAILFGGLGVTLLLLAAWSQTGGFVTMAFHLHGVSLPPTDQLWSVLRGAWTKGLVISGDFLLAGSGIALLGRSRTQWTLLIVPLLFIELMWAHVTLMPIAPKASVEDVGPFAQTLAAQHDPKEPPFRVLPAPDDSVVDPKLSPIERMAVLHAQMRADDPGRSGIAAFGHDYPSEPARVLGSFFATSRLAAFDPANFNVCYRVGADGLKPQPCGPRAWFASAISVASAGLAHRLLADDTLPKDTVPWELGPAAGLGHGTIDWEAASPERLRLHASTDAPTALVVNDAFTDGWSATIDGQPAPIYATEIAVRGVRLPAGSHQVEMTYKAPRFRQGLWLSLAGLILSVGLLVIRPKQ